MAPFLPAADTSELKDLYERNGLVSSWYGFVEGTNQPKQLEFVDKFKERFGRIPRPDAAFAYDNVFLLAEALGKCVTETAVDQDCLSDRIQRSKYLGIAGRLEFNVDGLSNRDVPLIRVNKGVWVAS